MAVYSSKSTRRFYSADKLASNLPYDAFELTGAQYLDLLTGRAAGGSINFDTEPPSLIAMIPGLPGRRTLAAARINQQRDAILFGGITFEGNVYQSDTLSRQRLIDASKNITASAAVPTDYVWRTTDNRNIAMTGEKVVRFSIMAYNQQTAVLVISRALKDEIRNSTTPELVTWPAIDMTTAHPDDEVLLGNPMVDVPEAARRAMTALQAEALAPYLKTADLPKGAQVLAIPTTGTGTANTGSRSIAGYSTPPKVIPVVRVEGDTLYWPEILAVTATAVTVRAKRTRGTLLLSAGPVETAPSGTVVNVAVLP